MFCFCPLYNYDCKGNFTILKDGIKDCSNCEVPHKENGHDYIVGFLRDLNNKPNKKKKDK